jgi:phosphoesterase RecJ-like protein
MTEISNNSIEKSSEYTHYPEANTIVERLNNTEIVYIAGHRSPDADSLGSALAMAEVLKQYGINAVVLSKDKVPQRYKFLPGAENVIEDVDYSQYDFQQGSKRVEFLAVDCASWQQVTDQEEIDLPPNDLPVIKLDHHTSGTEYAGLNLVRTEASSASEIVYEFMQNIGVPLNERIATCLMTGIVGDTGNFRWNMSDRTLGIAGELKKSGANLEKINGRLNAMDLNTAKMVGWLVNNMQTEEDGLFVYTAAPYEVYQQFGTPQDAKDMVCKNFIQSIEGIPVGIVIIEKEPGKLSVSFRISADSEGKIDVGAFAKQKWNGGGHPKASGATVRGNFSEKVAEVLLEARNFLKNGQ